MFVQADAIFVLSIVKLIRIRYSFIEKKRRSNTIVYLRLSLVDSLLVPFLLLLARVRVSRSLRAGDWLVYDFELLSGGW